MDIRFVYGIYCGKRLLYIGSTMSPGSRFNSHLSEARKCIDGSKPLYPILKRLLAYNIPFKFKIIFMGNEQQGYNKEKELIKKNFDLLSWQCKNPSERKSRRFYSNDVKFYYPQGLLPIGLFAHRLKREGEKSISLQLCKLLPPEKYFLLFEK